MLMLTTPGLNSLSARALLEGQKRDRWRDRGHRPRRSCRAPGAPGARSLPRDLASASSGPWAGAARL